MSSRRVAIGLGVVARLAKIELRRVQAPARCGSTRGEEDRPRQDLGEVFELATVRLNGVDLGTRIAPPYVFPVPEGVVSGSNTIQIDVTNTLAKAQPDFFSAFAQQEPSGLLGPVKLVPLTRRTSTGEDGA